MKWLVLTVLPAAAFGLDNSITIRDNSGSQQTEVPVTVMAAIAKGEIAGYARPAVTVYNQDGSVYAARAVAAHWQSDVKTRWRDGVTAPLAVTAIYNRQNQTCGTPCTETVEGVTVPSTPYVRVAVENHGFLDGEKVTISGCSAATALNGAWSVVDRSDGTFALAGLASTASTNPAGCTVTGPANGSWATGLVTLIIPVLPAQGRVRIDFVNDANPSHVGSQSATDSAALTRAQLAARTWDAKMTVSMPVQAGSTGSFTADARTMLEDTVNVPSSDCGAKKWLSGPLVTEWIVESGCTVDPYYDFGWTPVGPNSGRDGFVVAAGSSLARVQSDGSQTFEVVDASDLDVSNGPVLMQYKTGNVSPTGASYTVEYFYVSAKNGNMLTVEAGTRGTFNSGTHQRLAAAASTVSSGTALTVRRTTGACTSSYYHGLTAGETARIWGNSVAEHNREFVVETTPDLCTFTTTLPSPHDATGDGGMIAVPRAIPAGAVLSAFQGKDATSAVYRNFRPWFHVRAYTAPDGNPFGGVRIRYGLSNANPHKPAAGWISVAMTSTGNAVRWKSGLPVENFSEPAAHFHMQAQTEISKVFWDGADPEHYCVGGGTVDPCSGTRARRWLLDPNLDYKVYAGFILPFDNTPLDTNSPEFTVYYERFMQGDKGDAATPMEFQGSYGFQGVNGTEQYWWTKKVLGASYLSAWRAAGGVLPIGAGTNDEYREEAFYWSRALSRTLPVLGTEPRAWEILFGTSVPGGAGLQTAEHHMPLSWIESGATAGDRAATYSTQCNGDAAACKAWGRVVTIDARPTIYGLKPVDGSGQAAGEKVAFNNWTGSSFDSKDSHWWGFLNPGIWLIGDQTLDSAHRMPHSPFLYLITGDFYDLRHVQTWAGFFLAFKNPASVSTNTESIDTVYNGGSYRHNNWGVLTPAAGHPRTGLWPIMGISWALALTPNTPQFGDSYVQPEAYYYAAKLAKSMQAWEGMVGKTDGWFQPADSNCTGIRFDDSGADPPTTANTNDVWCWARQEMGRTRSFAPFWIHRAEAFNDPTYIDETKTEGSGGPPHPMGIALWQARRLGIGMVAPMHERVGKFLINLVVNEAGSPYRAARYRYPMVAEINYTFNDGIDGPEAITRWNYFPSVRSLMDARAAGLGESWDVYNSNNEFGYAHYWRASLAGTAEYGITDSSTPGCRVADIGGSGCTGQNAHDSFVTALGPDKLAEYANAKRTAQLPPAKIFNLAAMPGATGAAITYRAPTEAACTYSYGLGSPTSSLDDNDASDGGGGVIRTVNLSGLTGGGNYYFRVTCPGWRVASARSMLSFITGGGAGGKGATMRGRMVIKGRAALK